MRLDGVAGTGGGSNWGSILLANAEAGADITIDLAVDFDYTTMDGSVEVNITPDAGFSGDYTLRVVTVENDLVFKQYSQGTWINPFTHNNVMRGMFPLEGMPVSIVDGSTTTVDVPINLNAPVHPGYVDIVAFVQDDSDLSILNSARINLSDNVPITVPNLNILSAELLVNDTDGDGKLNRGESADLAFEIENGCEWSDATDITAYLSSTSPFVTITDSVGVVGSVAQCETGSNFEDLFALSLSESAPLVGEVPLTVRFTANQAGEFPYEILREYHLVLDMFQLGYPVTVDAAAAQGNAVVDIDGDGDANVIYADVGGNVHVLGVTGNAISGFPVALPSGVLSSPAIADIDNDGDLEIVVTCRDNNLYVIQHTGAYEAIASGAGALMATPSLVDIDADGDYEIIAPGYGNDILIVHHDGSHNNGSPILVDGERMTRGAAVVDILGYGWVIAVASQSGNLHVLDLDGDELPGFPVALGAGSQSDISVGDVDADGNLEIVVGSDNRTLSIVAFNGQIEATHDNGVAPVRSSPALVDVVAGGGLEIAFVTMDGTLWVIDGTGAVVDGWPQAVGAFSLSSVAAADINNDGSFELFAGSDDEYIYGFHSDGTAIEGFPVFVDEMVKAVPTIADLDGDGNLEVVNGHSTGLVAIDVKSDPGSADSWYTDQGSYMRNGVFPMGITSLDEEGFLPRTLTLQQNYPNPFNPSTAIRYGLPQGGEVNITVFNVLGHQVANLESGYQTAGWYELSWDGHSGAGVSLPSGMYYARLEFGGQNQYIKMLLMK